MCKYNKQYLQKQLEQLEKRLETTQDEEKRREIQRKIDAIRYAIEYYGDKIDHSEKIEPSGFCILHDPNACKEKPEEVEAEFLKWLEKREKDPNTEEIVAIGFNLPAINLANHTFNKKTTFALTIFNQLADFRRATFKGETDFGGATFEEEASLSWATFEEEADFSLATFKGATYFVETTFKGEADFEKITVWEKINFDNVYVGNELFFKNLALYNLFNASQISSYVSLRRIRLCEEGLRGGRILIDGCLIDRFSLINTDLSPSRIVIRNPKYAIHGREILLADKQLLQAKQRYNKHKNLILKYLETKQKLEKSQQKHEKVGKKQPPEIFKQKIARAVLKLYLGYLTARLLVRRAHKIPVNELHYTNKITKECRQLQKEAKEILSGKPRKKVKSILDLDLEAAEKLIEDVEKIARDSDLTLDNVLSVYRGFREHYDYMLRYEDSGRLFVGEMRLRKQFASWRGEKMFYLLYDLLAVYGESIWRPLIASALTILASSVLLNLEPPAPGVPPPTDPAGLLQAAIHGLARLPIDPIGTLQSLIPWLKLRESVLTFLQMRNLENSGWISLAERLLAIPIFGSLIVALRRKLERRIRH